MHARFRFLNLPLLAGALLTASAHADQLGNPTRVGQPGSLEVSVGGGKSSNLSLDFDSTTATTTVGNLTNVNAVQAGSSTFREDKVFAGIAYTVNPRLQVSGNLGSGKDTGQKSNTFGIGVKSVPAQENTDIKFGLMLRAQRVKVDTQGPFTLTLPYANATDGVNNNLIQTPLNGTETLKYNQYDIFLGASTSSGAVRPYGGFALTKISGSDNLALGGSATIATCPVAGGACTTSVQNASFNSRTNVSGTKMFSVILGLDFNPDSAIGMTLEARLVSQRMVTLAGNFRF